MTRAEHLDWAKARALQMVDVGDLPGALASILSDITKWTAPMYEPEVLTVATVDGLWATQKTPAAVRHWIEGFG